MKTTTTQLPPDHCPHCGHEITAASIFGQKVAPSPEDFTVCIECRKLAVFDEKLRLRKPTPDEISEALEMPRLMELQLALAHTTAE